MNKVKSTKLFAAAAPKLSTSLFATLSGALLLVFLGEPAVAIASAGDGNLARVQTFSYGGLPGTFNLSDTNNDRVRRVTVSPVGIANTLGVRVANDGADFGPDTAGTETGGLQEALNAISGGGMVAVTGCGTITLKKSIIATGNGQTVSFNASTSTVASGGGTTITGTGCQTINLTPGSPYNSGGVFLPFYDGVSHNYSQIRWFGNGVTVNVNKVPSSAFYAVFDCRNVAYAIAGTMTSQSVVDGFNVVGVMGTGVALIGTLSTVSGVSPTPTDQTIHEVVLSNLSIAYDATAPGSPTGIYIGGNARQILVEHCVVDQRLASLITDADAFFVTSDHGASVRHLAVRDCLFFAYPLLSFPYNHPFELQGSTFQSGVTTEYISFADSEFVNGQSLIDDHNITAYSSYIDNVEFLRCRFSGSTVKFYGQAPPNPIFFGPVSSNYPLGYIRFVDCNLGGTSWTTPTTPTSFSTGTLAYRSPGQCLDISSLFPGSYTNGEYQTGVTDGSVPEYGVSDQMITVSGGTGVTITIDSVPVIVVPVSPAPGEAFTLRPGHTIVISSTSAPTVNLCPL